MPYIDEKGEFGDYHIKPTPIEQPWTLCWITESCLKHLVAFWFGHQTPHSLIHRRSANVTPTNKNEWGGELQRIRWWTPMKYILLPCPNPAVAARRVALMHVPFTLYSAVSSHCSLVSRRTNVHPAAWEPRYARRPLWGVLFATVCSK